MQCLELWSWGMVAEDANSFPGMLGAKGTKMKKVHGAQNFQHQSFPWARQENSCNSPEAKGGKLISAEAGESALEQTHTDRRPHLAWSHAQPLEPAQTAGTARHRYRFWQRRCR